MTDNSTAPLTEPVAAPVRQLPPTLFLPPFNDGDAWLVPEQERVVQLVLLTIIFLAGLIIVLAVVEAVFKRCWPNSVFLSSKRRLLRVKYASSEFGFYAVRMRPTCAVQLTRARLGNGVYGAESGQLRAVRVPGRGAAVLGGHGRGSDQHLHAALRVLDRVRHQRSLRTLLRLHAAHLHVHVSARLTRVSSVSHVALTRPRSWKFVLNLWSIAQIVTIIPGLVGLAVQEYYWYVVRVSD